MTQRRAHWTDDLIEGVRSKIGIHQHGPIGLIRIYNPFDDEVYNVIAEVEDWQAQHHIVSAPAMLLMLLERAEKAEAQIQTVRDFTELHDSLDPWAEGYNAALHQVWRVLDGAQ